jgi:hypothetical protein
MKSDSQDHSPAPGDLAAVFSAEQIDLLKAQWIASAEEFIAVVATDEGRAGIRALLHLTDEQLDACTQELASQLPAEVVEALRRSSPGGQLGLLLPEQTD